MPWGIGGKARALAAPKPTTTVLRIAAFNRSQRCALVGDQLAALGVKNGWAGIVVYGCIRDSVAIGEMDIGVLALDTHPLKSIKRNVGEADIPVAFAGAGFIPGHYLYADADGVLVSPTALLA